MPNGQSAQLANLKPWTKDSCPSTKGHPGLGRPKGYRPISSWLTSLSVKPSDELEKIVENRNNPPYMRGAARQLLTQAGDIPEARVSDILASFGEVADRTEGKPIQVQHVGMVVGDVRPIMIDQRRFEEAMGKLDNMGRIENAVNLGDVHGAEGNEVEQS